MSTSFLIFGPLSSGTLQKNIAWKRNNMQARSVAADGKVDAKMGAKIDVPCHTFSIHGIAPPLP